MNRLFAIVPAAGLSRRMGQPKLLLPLGGETVVARLLSVLDRPEIEERLVVIRPDDEPLAAVLARLPAVVLRPQVAPPDMRTSVELALADIRQRHNPDAHDGWLLVPADHPVLEPAVLERMVAEWNGCDASVLVPRCGARRGHPTFFRWRLAGEVPHIPVGQGLNWLVKQHAAEVREVEFDDSSVITDLDTPEDYERLRRRWTCRDEVSPPKHGASGAE